MAYVRATFGKCIPRKVLPVPEKPYILQFWQSSSLQNPSPPFQKCSVSNEKCPPRPSRQFLELTSPVKTRQGFDSAALHFQICLVDVANRFSSDFQKNPTDTCLLSNENQCFSSKSYNWGPQMTLVSWCHHDSYVYRLGHCHVGRRRPSCAVYTIMAHFGSESCCRLRKTEFFSKLTHFLLIAGFKSFSFARFSTFLGLSFPKPFPFCRKTVVYIILAGTTKTNVSAAQGKLIISDNCFQSSFSRFIDFPKSLTCNSWFTYLKFPCCNEWPVARSDGSAHS